MKLLVLLGFGTFLFVEKVICRAASSQQWMETVVSLLAEVSHDKANIKDLPWPVRRHANVSRPLRKPSMTFLCRDIISFICLPPSV